MFVFVTVNVCHNEEVEDQEEYTDTDLGAVEEHKSVILHLLSQLKLGMDLTKVSILLSQLKLGMDLTKVSILLSQLKLGMHLTKVSILLC